MSNFDNKLSSSTDTGIVWSVPRITGTGPEHWMDGWLVV